MSTPHADRGSSYRMLPVEEALDLVLQETKKLTLQCKLVPLVEALGRTLAEDLHCDLDLPQFPASMKDGYCLNVNETEKTDSTTYTVVDTVLAGRDVSDFPKTISDKHVYKIMTGAPLPISCNTVVMIEDTTLLESDPNGTEVKISIQIPEIHQGRDVRQIGSDIKQGELILKQGETIQATEIGLLSSCGISAVKIIETPTIGVLSTGDEVIDPSVTQKLQPGQIFDANRPMLKALLNQFDSAIHVIDCGIVADESEILFSTIQTALDSVDVLISSGGVSMGEVDLVKKWMEDNGTVHFGRVLMKPGKPLTFATFEVNGKQKLMFATPGNPVSSYVTSVLFVLPCIRALTGKENAKHPIVEAKLKHPIRLDPQRPEYHRATMWWSLEDKCFYAQSTGSQASSRLLSMRSANALLVLPQSSDTLQEGTAVSAMVIGNLPNPDFNPPPVKLHHHHHRHHQC